MLVNAGIIFILEEEMKEFLIGQEVQFGKSLSFGIQEHLHCEFQLLEDTVIFSEYC